MNGPETTKMSGAGERRPNLPNMPGSSVLQQPSTGPHGPNTSTSANGATQGHTPGGPTGASHSHASPPLDQYHSQNAYTFAGPGAQQQNNNRTAPSSYHFYSGAHASFHDSNDNVQHHNYQQAPDDYQNQPNTHAHYYEPSSSRIPLAEQTLPKMLQEDTPTEFEDMFELLLPDDSMKPAHEGPFWPDALACEPPSFNTFSEGLLSPLPMDFDYKYDPPMYSQNDQEAGPDGPAADKAKATIKVDVGASVEDNRGPQHSHAITDPAHGLNGQVGSISDGDGRGVGNTDAMGGITMEPQSSHVNSKIYATASASNKRRKIIPTPMLGALGSNHPIISTNQQKALGSTQAQNEFGAQATIPQQGVAEKHGFKSHANRRSTIHKQAPNDATFGFDPVELKGLTLDEALEIITDFVPLKVDVDDIEEVKAQPKQWILAIMGAFGKPHSDRPIFSNFGEILKEFPTWQTQHWIITNAKLLDPERREACASALFYLVVQYHENGTLKGCGTFTLDPTLSCSRRLKLIIAAIEKSAIVRWDVAIGKRLDELIGSPIGSVKTKEGKKLTNERKKSQYKHLQAEKGAQGSPGVVSKREKGTSGDGELEMARNDERRLLAPDVALPTIAGVIDEGEPRRFETAGMESTGVHLGGRGQEGLVGGIETSE